MCVSETRERMKSCASTARLFWMQSFCRLNFFLARSRREDDASLTCRLQSFEKAARTVVQAPRARRAGTRRRPLLELLRSCGLTVTAEPGSWATQKAIVVLFSCGLDCFGNVCFGLLISAAKRLFGARDNRWRPRALWDGEGSRVMRQNTRGSHLCVRIGECRRSSCAEVKATKEAQGR